MALPHDRSRAAARPSYINVTYSGFPKNVYVVITDVVLYATDEDECELTGGGVLGKNNFAIMFSFGNCPIVEDFIEMVTHEIGHTLSLQDAFKDALLGKPAKGSTKDNYMDYKIRDRKRFYRTQWELVLNYTFVNPSPQ